MTMSFAAPTRPLAAAVTLCRQCARHLHRQPTALAPASSTISRHFPPAEVANNSNQSAPDLAKAKPRWAQTPPAMRAPHRVRPKTDQDDFAVNEDPKKLDQAYVSMLGQDGDRLLSEEVKWLAVTHKSFDFGRRGFNERLAFLGRRIVELQTSLALLDAPQPEPVIRQRASPDQYGRLPAKIPAIENVENVAIHIKERILDRKRLASLGVRYGLDSVIRWHPRQVASLQSSGIDTVLRDAIFAIVGAVALQKGGEEANRIVRQRILGPLGMRGL